MSHARRHPRHHRRGSDDYPIAIIAPYGPDNRLATKLVVSIVPEPTADPSDLRTWTTVAADVRHDPTIAAEVAEFLRERDVRQSVAADRIMGCPHEEGIDYPMGRTCPACPFWAAVDRFTHEPVRVPVPTMSVAEVLDTLTLDDSERLEEALTSAEGLRDVLVDPLIAAIDRVIDSPEARGTTLDGYALYLLASWREARAYPSVVRWLALPDDGPFDIAGDVVTEAGSRILASVCDGDLDPIRRLALDPRADTYGRSAGFGALALLAAWKEVSRERIIEVFLGFARGGLEREPSHLWERLALACVEMEAVEVFPEIRQAFRDGLIDEGFVDETEIDEVEANAGMRLRETREGQPPIGDVLEETSWWDRSDVDAAIDTVDAPDWDGTGELEVREPYRAGPKIGRNDPCSCGSGKKYKKCCGAPA